jgi:phosphate acetyltransferase
VQDGRPGNTGPSSTDRWRHNAISPEAVQIKKIPRSPANVLVVPDLRQETCSPRACRCRRGCRIVLGARVPIILTSRADDETARLASCAVAQLLVAARRANAGAAIQ